MLGGAGLNSLKSLNLTKLYPNNNKNNKNKVKSKPLELYELAGNKKQKRTSSRLNGIHALELSNVRNAMAFLESLKCILILKSVCTVAATVGWHRTVGFSKNLS
jgi:hypothetical protein